MFVSKEGRGEGGEKGKSVELRAHEVSEMQIACIPWGMQTWQDQEVMLTARGSAGVP